MASVKLGSRVGGGRVGSIRQAAPPEPHRAWPLVSSCRCAVRATSVCKSSRGRGLVFFHSSDLEKKGKEQITSCQWSPKAPAVATVCACVCACVRRTNAFQERARKAVQALE